MSLHAQLVGTGPRRVVLLHGFLGSGRNLAPVARRWAERAPDRSFLLVDLTGHGASPALAPDATLGSIGLDVLATARSHGVSGPISIVGHSLGGRVALALRLARPADVGAVTLLDIAPGPIGPEIDEGGTVLAALLAAPDRFASREEARRTLASGVDRALVDWLLMNLVPDAGAYRWRIDRAGLERFRPQITMVDLWPAVTASTAPLACVRGGESPYVTDESARRLEAAGVPVVTLPRAGHFVHVDALEAVVDALERLHRD